jgi:hypothetical protein
MPENTTTPNSDPIPSTNGALDLISRGAREGAADARAAAERAWESASLFLSRFVYTTSYGISYGVVFSATLIARTVPKDNAAVRGLIDGAHAAIQQVDEIRGTTLAPAPAAPALAAG